MSAPSKPRKRAVRLTPEALDDLRKALAQRWQEDAREGRLTHETRAELMGVSVATAKNILSGAGADRSSFALAFKRLRLPWDDAFCEFQQEEVPAPEEPEDPLALSEPPIEPEPHPILPEAKPPARKNLGLFIAATLLAAVGLGAAFVVRRPAPDGLWMGEFNRASANGENLYHRVEYDAARKEADRAFAIAQAHDSASRMAGANHLQGNVEGAQGRLLAAKERYEREYEARMMALDADHIPFTLESLGDVETRLGHYGAARKHLEVALKEFQRLHLPFEVASVQRDLGSVALGEGKLDVADEWFRQSLKGLRGMAQPATETDVRGRMALVLLARGRAAEARTLLQGCLSFWTKNGHARWTALADMHLGLAEAQLHDVASARRRIARSRATFAQIGDEARVAEAESHLRHLSAPAIH